MTYKSIPKKELQFVSNDMIGLVLMRAGNDSDGNPILPYKYYRVDRHIPSQKLIIQLVDRDGMDKDFINSILHHSLKNKIELN